MNAKICILASLVALVGLSCSHQPVQKSPEDPLAQSSQTQSALNCDNHRTVQYGYAGIGWGGPGMATAFYR